MKMIAVLSLAVALLACHDSVAPPTDQIQDGGKPVSAIVSANGDTLAFTLRWGKPRSADSYDVTVTSSDPTTTGLPTHQIVNDTVIHFTAINTVYDSLSFTATVFSRRGSLTGLTPSTITWHYVRRPGTPGPIVVDSLNMIAFTSVDVVPAFALTSLVVGQTVQMCAFMRFTGGLAAIRAKDVPNCGAAFAARYPPESTVVSSKVQAWTDVQCIAWSPRAVGDTTVVCT